MKFLKRILGIRDEASSGSSDDRPRPVAPPAGEVPTAAPPPSVVIPAEKFFANVFKEQYLLHQAHIDFKKWPQFPSDLFKRNDVISDAMKSLVSRVDDIVKLLRAAESSDSLQSGCWPGPGLGTCFFVTALPCGEKDAAGFLKSNFPSGTGDGYYRLLAGLLPQRPEPRPRYWFHLSICMKDGTLHVGVGRYFDAPKTWTAFHLPQNIAENSYDTQRPNPREIKRGDALASVIDKLGEDGEWGVGKDVFWLRFYEDQYNRTTAWAFGFKKSDCVSREPIQLRGTAPVVAIDYQTSS